VAPLTTSISQPGTASPRLIKLAGSRSNATARPEATVAAPSLALSPGPGAVFRVGVPDPRNRSLARAISSLISSLLTHRPSQSM